MSTAVKEAITGTRAPMSSNTFSMAYSAALAFRVSKTVSTKRMSTPPSSKPLTASEYASTISSKLISRYPGSSTAGDRDRVLLVGPILPATNRGFSGLRCVYSSAIIRASRAPSRFMSWTEFSRPNSDSPKRVAVNVLVVRMSAPASKYCRWMLRMRSGRVSESTSTQPLRSLS